MRQAKTTTMAATRQEPVAEWGGGPGDQPFKRGGSGREPMTLSTATFTGSGRE